MTGRIEPARVQFRPVRGAVAAARCGKRGIAGARAAKAGAAGTEIFAQASEDEAAETESGIVQCHGAVRIAFAGGDGIAHAGNEKVADGDVSRRIFRRSVGQGGRDRGDGRLAIADAQADFLFARRRRRLRRAVAVVEAPRAYRARRQIAADRDADAVILRREIDFAAAVALAEFRDAAALTDAQLVDDAGSPAAALARAFEPPFGRENAVAARRRHMPLKVGLVAEEAKAVLHLPLDPRPGIAGRQGQGRRRGRLSRRVKTGHGQEKGEKAKNDAVHVDPLFCG